MKFTIATALATLLASADAFPHMAMKMAEELSKRQISVPPIPLAGGPSFTGAPTLVFSEQDQRVSVSGNNAYRAPRSGDARGVCPGLNALANHGYIARNGVTNLLEAIDGTNSVFNMGLDLAGFLSTISVLFAGDVLTTRWSIGRGPPGRSGGLLGTGLLGGLLGNNPTGLDNTHNRYESDSSPTRGDLYQFCNNFEVQLPQFQELYDLHKGEPDAEVSYTFEDLVNFRATRFDQSVSRNPDFFYGPFSGLIVSQAAFTFIPAFMSNHSAEFPNGRLSRKTLASFFGITESGGTGRGDGTLSYAPGTERIPENWYRRSSTNPYTIPAFVADTVRLFATHPRTFVIGGNTNGVDSFTGVDAGDLTGGVFNTANLLEGDNLLCFVFGFLQQGFIDQANGLSGALRSTVNRLVGTYVTNPISNLACPRLARIPNTAFEQFPGANPNVGGATCPAR